MIEKKFRTDKVFSPRLNKEIEVEVYDGDNGMTVISSASLRDATKAIIDGLSGKLGSELIQMFPNENGEVGYCLVRAWLRVKKEGTETDEVETIIGYGEFTASGAKSEISLTNPFATAQKRAEAKCFIKFLQLPGRVYSSDEIEATTRTNFKEMLESKTADVNGFAAASVDSAIISPEKVGNAEKPVDVEKAAKAEEVKPVEAPKANAEVVNKDDPLSKKTAKESKQEMKKTTEKSVETSETNSDATVKKDIPNVPETEASVTENPAVEEVKPDVEEDIAQPEKSVANSKKDPMDLIVIYGPAKGKNLTVREVLSNPAYERFVTLIKSGAAKMPAEPEKAAIYNAIKSA